MSQPYLFYSDREPNSKQIIETLKALNKAGLFKFVDVLSIPRNQIPPWLKSVPTLYVPDKKEVIVGKDIYGYIAKPTNSRNELPTKPEDGKMNPQNTIGDLTPWGFEGKGNIGESYSLWDNPTQFASEGGSFFTFLNDAVMTATGGSQPTSQNTIEKSKTSSNSDVSKRMEEMVNQRKKEFSSVDRK